MGVFAATQPRHHSDDASLTRKGQTTDYDKAVTTKIYTIIAIALLKASFFSRDKGLRE